MKLALWKRTALAGLMTLSVAGASAATFSAGDASAEGVKVCYHYMAGARPNCVEF